MAYYPFNGNANDASGNGNNAILNNATLTSDRLGNPNSAYAFNGIDNFIQVPNSPTLNTTNQISICAWVKVSGFYQGTCHGNNIVMKGDGDYLPGNYMIRFDDSFFTNNQNCSITTPDVNHESFFGLGSTPYASTPFIKPGQWYSVVYTCDGATAKIYVNCQLVGSGPANGISFTNTANLFFGKLNSAQYPYWFNGTMDEIRIYNRPINQDEVNAYGDCSTPVTSCSNWLSTPTTPSYVQVGQLNVVGDKITVEATINRTTPYIGGTLYAGDIVSKHDQPSDVNYLLRPNEAEITTDQGYFRTPDICEIELNKTYHVAMVYDGSTLKFYRNGFLMSQIAASGNLYQNSWNTRIGFYEHQLFNENFIGYINEVRIWNVARTQAQLQTYMNTSLPNPTTQPGLLAYYTFDNLLNKQGNPAWNGTLGGSASINQTNPNCNFIADSCTILSSPVTASFTTPDTVCVNSPVTIQNTSQNATNYFWSFCAADFNTTPEAINLGNPNGVLNSPVFGCYALDDNGNYYGLLINYNSGELLRLNFGNSLLNTPTGENLGNFSNALPEQGEGIQLLRVNGNWTAIMVGGGNGSFNSSPRIVKIDFGNSLANSPVATNWGNIGGLNLPHDLYITQESGNYYGFAINVNDNTITRLSFGPDFNNTPPGINLGNIGNIDYPAGFNFVKYNGNWFAFIANRVTNSLTRLDFGSSLLNTPTGTNIGNPGNLLDYPRDISLFKTCDGVYGFVVNETSNEIVKLNFGGDPTSSPQATDLGNLGNLNFPHSISDLFRVGNDIYAFIPNVNNNSLTRIRFTGCQNLPGSTQQNPAPVSYPQAGTYTINLLVDLGLPTQTSYCKQIVVQDVNLTKSNDTSICANSSIQLIAAGGTNYSWTPASSLNNSTIANPVATPVNTTKYFVTATNNFGCSKMDSILITVNPLPVITKSNDTSICINSSVQLEAGGGINYSWSPASSLNNSNIANPVATPVSPTKYFVTVTNGNGCTKTDSIKVGINPVAVITKSNDTTICNQTSVRIFAGGGTSYLWSPASSLDNPTSANPLASPVSTTLYKVAIKDANSCSYEDSVKIIVKPVAVFNVTPDNSICNNSSVQLQASGGDTYTWSPSTGLDNPNISNPVASPAATTNYTVIIHENICNETGTLSTNVMVLPLPDVQATSANDLTCSLGSSQLNATGATNYVWSPSTGLNNNNIANPIAAPDGTTVYKVTGTDNNGCSNFDTVIVKADFNMNALYLLPNSFTPNGDGINDCFGIKYWGVVKELDFNIYNRFGERVFHTTDPNLCWDGTYKGNPQSPNVFVYIITAKTACGIINRKGTVALLK